MGILAVVLLVLFLVIGIFTAIELAYWAVVASVAIFGFVIFSGVLYSLFGVHGIGYALIIGVVTGVLLGTKAHKRSSNGKRQDD